MEKITVYKCDICGEIFSNEDVCLSHEDRERRIIRANEMLINEGKTLKEINDECKIWYDRDDFEELYIPKYLENVTKDNCFKITYLQHCRKPCYQIKRILKNGKVQVGGYGFTKRYFSVDLYIDEEALEDPRPLEELYVG